MFSLASHNLLGRRVLIIEREREPADDLRAAIASKGGIPLGPTDGIDEALCYIATVGKVDSVMLDAHMAATTTRIIPDLFAERGIETIFVTGHDDWYDDDNDDLDEIWSVSGPLLVSA